MRHAILPATAAIILMITGCKSEADSKPEPSPEPKIVKEKWHWDQQAKQDETAGYAQVVKVGNTLYISGVPTNDISYEAISRLYQALEKSLKAYGATSHNVVKETLYTTDIEEMKKHNEARREFYTGDFPAATWVQISRLYEAEAKVEVDLVAVILDDNQKGNK